jgi:membrane-associated phospholipid phosphatase
LAVRIVAVGGQIGAMPTVSVGGEGMSMTRFDGRRGSRIVRRTALKLGAAMLAAASATTTSLVSNGVARPAFAQMSGEVEPDAGTWRTWVLNAGSQLQLGPPPDSATEIAEVRALVDQRNAQTMDLIAYWDTGAPATRWNEIAIAQTIIGRMTLRSYRAMALLNVAIYDATVAAWDSKYAHNRPHPTDLDPSISNAVAVPRSPAFPCEHAVTAGAASTVLAYLFPQRAATFTAQAEEAARSRVQAGVAFPSDAAAGLELGRAVGALVVARAQTDGTDAAWTGTVPVGPGLWQGANPAEPLAGAWKPWVLGSGDQLRLNAPPGHDSDLKQQELAEIRQFLDTGTNNPVAFYWVRDPQGRQYDGVAPVATAQSAFRWAVLNHLLWGEQVADMVHRYRLDQNAPRTARAYALVSVAGFDATIACWDTKYAYWAARPIHLDPSLKVLFPTPPHPTYPSGHATIAGATSAVLSHLFPRDGICFERDAEELAASRAWAGIHFRSDNVDGLTLGRAVGKLVIERARADGVGCLGGVCPRSRRLLLGHTP